jgi:serine protease Do
MLARLNASLGSRRRLGRFVLGGLVAASLAASPLLFRDDSATAQSLSSPHAIAALPSLAPLVKKVMGAVVNVSAEEKGDAAATDDEADNGDNGDNNGDNSPEQGQKPGQNPGKQFGQNSPFDELLRRFFEQQMPGLGNPMPRNLERVALGSGFLIDPDGYVVTNNHVVAGADKVTVIFQDDTRHPAKVIGRDTKTDLALLKIKADKPLPFVNWGDSNAAQVGDWVLAVGNPFGLGGTVSSGIISARGRDIHSGPYDDFLQLDAAINRGNSGGPTFNLAGEVIGINTAIYSPNGGSVGIGFAIPSSLAKPVIEQLKSHGKVDRGWLGVQIQEVTPEIARSLGLPLAEGALVADVSADGPAAKSGFKQGDVITSFDGHAIRHVRDLPIIVAETAVGEKAAVKVWRKEGQIILSPTIAPMPNNPKVAAATQEGAKPPEPQHVSALGLKLAPLDPDWRTRLHIPKGLKGVVVTSVANDSPFAHEGLQPGDVIQTIDQEPVATPHDAAKKLDAARARKSKSVLLLINRNGSNAYVAVSMDKSEDNG